MTTEDFDLERLGRRAADGLASLSPVVNGWARDLQSALSEVERLREVIRRIVDDETVVINEWGYLVVLMTDDPDHSSTIVDLAPEQFAAVKRALSGSSEEPR